MNPHRGLLHHLNIVVSDLSRSAPFYGAIFPYLGYDRAASSATFEDWNRWDLGTPHEISIVQVSEKLRGVEHVRGAVGHHEHLALCAADRADVDRFYAEVLRPLEAQGHCVVEDPPVECPEYDEGYYATFFFDPDGLKFEFVVNEGGDRRRAARTEATQPQPVSPSGPSQRPEQHDQPQGA